MWEQTGGGKGQEEGVERSVRGALVKELFLEGLSRTEARTEGQSRGLRSRVPEEDPWDCWDLRGGWSARVETGCY